MIFEEPWRQKSLHWSCLSDGIPIQAFPRFLKEAAFGIYPAQLRPTLGAQSAHSLGSFKSEQGQIHVLERESPDSQPFPAKARVGSVSGGGADELESVLPFVSAE
jgi:hypothetical protein